MNSEEQKTLLETIKANLERNEKGDIEIVFDPCGTFDIIPNRTNKGLVTYFQPQYAIDVDPYGFLSDSDNSGDINQSSH